MLMREIAIKVLAKSCLAYFLGRGSPFRAIEVALLASVCFGGLSGRVR
jgi:hypothetical protein